MNINKTVEIEGLNSMIKQMASHSREAALELATVSTEKKNQVLATLVQLIHENDDGDSVMLLLDGVVTISKALTIKIDQIEQPEKEFIKLSSEQYPFFGEISIFDSSNK